MGKMELFLLYLEHLVHFKSKRERYVNYVYEYVVSGILAGSVLKRIIIIDTLYE